MVGTIGLAGREEGSHKVTTVDVIFISGTAIGGATMFGTLAIAGTFTLVSGVAVIGLTFAGTAMLMESVMGYPVLLPTSKRQVSPLWFSSHSHGVTAVRWAFEQGLAFATVINTWAVWVMAVGVAALGVPWAGVLVGTTYGLVRALQLPLSAIVGGAGSRTVTRFGSAAKESPLAGVIASMVILIALVIHLNTL